MSATDGRNDLIQTILENTTGFQTRAGEDYSGTVTSRRFVTLHALFFDEHQGTHRSATPAISAGDQIAVGPTPNCSSQRLAATSLKGSADTFPPRTSRSGSAQSAQPATAVSHLRRLCKTYFWPHILLDMLLMLSLGIFLVSGLRLAHGVLPYLILHSLSIISFGHCLIASNQAIQAFSEKSYHESLAWLFQAIILAAYLASVMYLIVSMCFR